MTHITLHAPKNNYESVGTLKIGTGIHAKTQMLNPIASYQATYDAHTKTLYAFVGYAEDVGVHEIGGYDNMGNLVFMLSHTVDQVHHQSLLRLQKDTLYLLKISLADKTPVLSLEEYKNTVLPHISNIVMELAKQRESTQNPSYAIIS